MDAQHYKCGCDVTPFCTIHGEGRKMTCSRERFEAIARKRWPLVDLDYDAEFDEYTSLVADAMWTACQAMASGEYAPSGDAMPVVLTGEQAWRERAESAEQRLAAVERERKSEHALLVKTDTDLFAALTQLETLRTWLDNNTTFFNVDVDYPVEGPNIPTLAAVRNRIWYHATDDTGSYPFSVLMDRSRVPEPGCCDHPDQCAGLARCPRVPVCNE